MNDALEEIIQKIVESVDPDEIILFGSRAKGESREESDYDVCVLKGGVLRNGEVEKSIYLGLYGTGVPVDVIVESPEKFDELKNNPFLIYSEIAKYGRVVYEK